MPFKKGECANPGGRPKGSTSPNKDEWENFGEWMVKGGVERLNTEMNTLEGKEFVSAFAGILEYFKPKLARSENEHNVNASITINTTKYGD